MGTETVPSWSGLTCIGLWNTFDWKCGSVLHSATTADAGVLVHSRAVVVVTSSTPTPLGKAAGSAEGVAPPGGATIPISNRRPLKFPIPPMRVRHRRFHSSFSNSDFKTSGEVHGRFTHHYRKAKGTLRVHGRPLGAMQGKCDTGTDDWTASKQ